MSPEALLAVLVLAVAVYTVLPVERRLDLRLRIGPLDWAILAIAFFLIHYIKYYPVLDSLGIAPHLGPWRWGFDPELASYLIITVTFTLVWIHSRSTRLTHRKLPLLQFLAERLILERKFSDLFFLLERHLGALKQFTARQPSGEAKRVGSLEAHNILRRVLLSDDVAREMARSRPDLGLMVLELDLWERWEFLNLFGRALLGDSSSLLYFELRQNQNLLRGNRYYIPPENRLIYSLLHDAHRAHDLGIYKPFGDFALSELRRLGISPESDHHNFPLGDYCERDRWTCPVHAVIRFFDIMVLEALHQNVLWHMWLYYFPSITEQIVKNLQPHAEVDLDGEWPTPYHYLLYDIVKTLCNWVEELEEVPSSQENVVLENTDVRHQNNNIPKSAILALGQCFRKLLLSKKLEQGFKGYLVEIPLGLVKELRQKERQDYADVLAKSVAQAGWSKLAEGTDYFCELAASLRCTDPILRLDLQDDRWLSKPIEAAGFR